MLPPPQLKEASDQAERAHAAAAEALQAAIGRFASRERQVLKYSSQQAALAQQLAELGGQLEARQEQAEAHYRLAQQVHEEPIPDPGLPAQIQKEQKDLENRIALERHSKRILKSAADIHLEYLDLHNAFQQAQLKIKQTSLAYQNLKLTYRAREAEWKQFRAKLSERVNQLFAKHLGDMVGCLFRPASAMPVGVTSPVAAKKKTGAVSRHQSSCSGPVCVCVFSIKGCL